MIDSLNILVDKFSKLEYLKTDPIEFCYRYKEKKDIEIIGFISALFSYGNVIAIRAFLESLLAILGDSPFLNIQKNKLIIPGNLYYRFQTNQDIKNLFKGLSRILNEYSSLELLFGEKDKPTQERIIIFQNSLKAFLKDSKTSPLSNGLKFLTGNGNKNSANKRYNMFLRWMVRDKFPDFGIYKSFTKDNLLFPLDTHIVKISKILGITERKTIDHRMSMEITNKFKEFDADDPLLFDFPLSRLGILKECKVSFIQEICGKCELRNSCIIYTRSL